MARQKTARKFAGGRGSAEAIEKRRVARQLNSMLSGGVKRGAKLDGRTEKRRERLLEELREGRQGTALKPIDFVSHVNELIELGESVSSLKKLGVKSRRVEPTAELLEVVRRTQQAYKFSEDAWKMLGVGVEDEEASEPVVEQPAAKKRVAKKRAKA